ncbi:MAG: 3-keto-disaccharide hydrolase [Blastocatellia bacterium]
MKKYLWAGLLAVGAFSLLGVAGSKPVRLFDGKTFKDWEGNLQSFRIEDGAIVGGSLQARAPRNEFLCTTKEYSNFILRLKFKLLGDPQGANAGIQFRTERIPNHHEVIGYQADIGQQYWGALYDESRRKKVLAGPTPEEVAKLFKPNDWNEYVIRAEGRRIRLELNGRQTVDYTEPDETIKQTGCICLQIHGGPPSEAWYKDITLEAPPAKR